MRYTTRMLTAGVRDAARTFPALVVTGPRRSGKTTLLRRTFPSAQYWLLEEPDVLARFRTDPRGFVDSLQPPVILDEIQNAPELFAWIRARVDAKPARKGQWLLTGSQEAPLMQNIAESMAGRAAIFQLLSLSTRESSKVTMLRGGFPEVLAAPRAADTWFRSYVQTYLERDVRAVTEVRDLMTFRRFVALVATRCGQVVNRTDLAAPLGVSVPTISQWLSVLELTGQIVLVPPYFDNFGKRLVKSPKLYFSDTGLLCHLLGIDSIALLEKSSFLGAVFESFVASELVKAQIGRGVRRELYWFRDHQGLEVDFVVPQRGGRLLLCEAKTTSTAMVQDTKGMQRLREAIGDRVAQCLLVHRPGPRAPRSSVVAPGVAAVDLRGLLDSIGKNV
ncbi:MAG TPA: ATP-binding protein [Planctomycetota bacterium]|nr:ATP-binding protein [Planctomycetota bacterium]